MNDAIQVSLIASDFMADSIAKLPEWQALPESEIAHLASDLKAVSNRFSDRKPWTNARPGTI